MAGDLFALQAREYVQLQAELEGTFIKALQVGETALANYAARLGADDNFDRARADGARAVMWMARLQDYCVSYT